MRSLRDQEVDYDGQEHGSYDRQYKPETQSPLHLGGWGIRFFHRHVRTDEILTSCSFFCFRQPVHFSIVALLRIAHSSSFHVAKLHRKNGAMPCSSMHWMIYARCSAPP